jgi:hypothetical protein
MGESKGCCMQLLCLIFFFVSLNSDVIWILNFNDRESIVYMSPARSSSSEEF